MRTYDYKLLSAVYSVPKHPSEEIDPAIPSDNLNRIEYAVLKSRSQLLDPIFTKSSDRKSLVSLFGPGLSVQENIDYCVDDGHFCIRLFFKGDRLDKLSWRPSLD